MSEIELKPCPHCGEAEELYRSYHGLGGDEPYAIDCLGCGCDFTPREGMDVIAKWNTRAPDPALATKDAAIAELREALEPFVALANEVFERYEKSPGVYREAYDDYPNDRALWGFNDATLTYGHLRIARAALEASR